MSIFEELEQQWKDFCAADQEFIELLEKKVIPLLINKDEKYVIQGVNLLTSFGDFGLLFLLEKRDDGQIDIQNPLQALSCWLMKDLKQILKSIGLKVSGRKSELMERISSFDWMVYLLGHAVLTEVMNERSDWFVLYEGGCFDRMIGRYPQELEDKEFSTLSKLEQDFVIQVTHRMEEIENCTFMMGAGDEVKLSHRFVIGKYQVTQALWESVMGNNPSHFKGNRRPVEKVCWFDCVLFCNKLSEKEGLEKVYTIPDGLEQALKKKRFIFDEGVDALLKEICQNAEANGYRLPTDAEWEYCARANQDFTYSGSDNCDEVAWYEGNSERRTHSVGQKKGNGFGLYDMSGNIFEWCWNWWRDEKESSSDDSTQMYRSSRSGSWGGER